MFKLPQGTNLQYLNSRRQGNYLEIIVAHRARVDDLDLLVSAGTTHWKTYRDRSRSFNNHSVSVVNLDRHCACCHFRECKLVESRNEILRSQNGCAARNRNSEAGLPLCDKNDTLYQVNIGSSRPHVFIPIRCDQSVPINPICVSRLFVRRKLAVAGYGHLAFLPSM